MTDANDRDGDRTGDGDRDRDRDRDSPDGARPAGSTQPPTATDGGTASTAAEGSRARDPYDRTTTVIARSTVRLVVPVILVTSIALLLRGHNLPGGGFIGAVLTTTAFVLVYVVFGIDFLREVVGLGPEAGGQRLIAGYRWLFGLGLALAAGSGLVPVLFDLPFLTQGFVIVEHLPLYGEFEVASALAFDLGVYFTVVGALLAIVGEVGAE